MQNELYFYFKDVKRITEIYSIARDLKQKGFDAAKINVVVAEKKKELIAKTNSIKTLAKIIPKSGIIKRTPTTHLNIKVVNLNSGQIEITSENEVLL
ncbi:MAG: hypothetical protein HFI05_00415 [Lachnospiraceae bacterium]|jgi:hypothetical protein|nr:hypothetical protein [Lachnospiraceae bacterium]